MTEGQDKVGLAPVLALLTTITLWASSFSVMKVAVVTFGPAFMVWSRMVVATAILLPAAPRILARARYRAGDWRPLLLMGACHPCLYFLLESHAMYYTTSAQAGMLSSVLPLMVAAGAGIFLGERTAPRAWAGCAVAAAGVVWLTWLSAPTESASNPVLGNLLELGAMASGAGYMLLVRRLSARYGPGFLTLMQFGLGSLFFLPGALDPAPWRALAEPLAAASLAYLGVFVTLVAFGLWNWSSQRVPAARASALVNLIPVMAVAMGMAFLGETFSAWQFAACAVVLSGVLLSQWRPRRRRPARTAGAAPGA